MWCALSAAQASGKSYVINLRKNALDVTGFTLTFTSVSGTKISVDPSDVAFSAGDLIDVHTTVGPSEATVAAIS